MAERYISRSQALRGKHVLLHRRKQTLPNETMKFIAVIVLTAIVACASAAVLPNANAATYEGLIQKDDGKIVNLEDVDTDGGLSTGVDVLPIRHPRITCDLLSLSTPWGGFNHAACAARCLAQRKKGGSCRDGVCHCRG